MLKTDLPGSAMREVVNASKQALREAGHAEELERLVNDAELQLHTSLQAVHASWRRDRARRYRSIKHLSEGWHTAAIVQHMASGNRTNRQELKPGIDEMRISLTGVIPNTRVVQSTGFREFTGDVKFSACGDDLVGGITAAKSFEPVQRLHTLAPMLERKLNHVSARLRRFLGSDVEIEFTVDRGVLSILQARSAQMELYESPRTFKEAGKPVARGIGISGGAFRGRIAFNEGDVQRLRAGWDDEDKEADGILLMLENPVPDEIPLILSVDGLLSARGGSTSHAAVAVHSIEERIYCAVLGAPEFRVGADKAELRGKDGVVTRTFRAGDVISIHGQTGEVFAGSMAVVTVGNEA
jgi:pyruvate,orthophosphate dikinase